MLLIHFVSLALKKLEKIFLGLGSNIGDKFFYLSGAIRKINEEAGEILQISSCYETEAWGPVQQDSFVNCVLEISSILSPAELLSVILNIEKELGRERQVRYGPRTIDIDILVMGQMKLNQKKLVVPHPLLAERKFVLAPLCDVASSDVHPILKKTMKQLLLECQDNSNVNKLKTTISL